MGLLHPVVSGVLVATSRRDRMNSVVVVGHGRAAGGGSPALLIDPGWTPDELEAIARDLVAHRLTVVAGLATHAHHDHLLWHPGFGDVPRFASRATVSRAGTRRAALLADLGSGYPRAVRERFGRLRPLPTAELCWSGPTAHAVVHDAHEPGHTALWSPRPRVLVAGDLLSDTEIPLLGSGGSALQDYERGLALLEPFLRVARLVIPGHGTPTAAGTGRLAADRRYLNDLAAARPSDDPRLLDPAMRQADAEQRARLPLVCL